MKDSEHKMKSIKNITVAIIVGAVLGFASNASALNLTQGDAYYVGSINDGIPSSPSDEASFINLLTTYGIGQTDIQNGTEIYNREGSSLNISFPTAVITGALKDESTGVTSINALGYLYIVGKYDAGQAGSLVWFFPNGVPEEVFPQSTFMGKGLSHISAYNATTQRVPDAGTTSMLLGLGLSALAVLRRTLA